MTTRISIEPGSLTTLALAAIFVLVFAVTCRALRGTPLFGDRDGWITAVCVAALSVIGLLASSDLQVMPLPGPVSPKKATACSTLSCSPTLRWRY